MKLSDLLNVKMLENMITDGYVRFGTHKEFPELRIFEYTTKTMIEREWNHVTMKTRGLIVNWETQEVLARPFDKFFNYGEPSQLDQIRLELDDEVDVYDKLDGSLGIRYIRPDGRSAIATKGSFHSEQADWATKQLHLLPSIHWDDNLTYLFEIIYPENRIVVTYDFEGLVLLGARVIDDGDDYFPEDLPEWSGRTTTRYHYKTLREALEAPPRTNAEGLVVYLQEFDVRVKIKQVDYVAMHKIVTGLTERRVWENMVEGRTLLDLCAIVPDEWHEWLKKTHKKILMDFLIIKTCVESDYRQLVKALDCADGPGNWDRKEFARLATSGEWGEYPGLMFSLLDGRDITPIIWKYVDPSTTKKR